MTDEDGKPRDKLVAIKQAWAEAGRLLTGKPDPARAERLPPGQRLVTNWPVLDLGVQPAVSREDWALDVDGAVVNPLRWTWADLMAQPQVESVSDIHCVTQWSRFDNRWSGVSTQHLLSVAQPLPGAAHVVLHGYDGYTTNVRLDHFAGDDCLLAHSHDEAPISRVHGGPVRVIIPQWYLWKSAKWLKRIEIRRDDSPGFWEVRGYHNEGDPWSEQRYR
ncbi:sulfite oxidase-like oxidoreductase [Polymorphobacter sp.]|uniref:sulfite oxidase-like oxidoreductase n=1 Tax=Polymorphobacter sp. TaxID=1909290 RepID=UPI003F705150